MTRSTWRGGRPPAIDTRETHRAGPSSGQCPLTWERPTVKDGQRSWPWDQPAHTSVPLQPTGVHTLTVTHTHTPGNTDRHKYTSMHNETHRHTWWYSQTQSHVVLHTDTHKGKKDLKENHRQHHRRLWTQTPCRFPFHVCFSCTSHTQASHTTQTMVRSPRPSPSQS